MKLKNKLREVFPNLYKIAKSYKQRLKRICKPVIYSSIIDLEPVSRRFGSERGLPIDRWYIENFLFQNSELITGKVLEVGENTYSRRYGSDGIESYILRYEENNNAIYKEGEYRVVVGDLSKKESITTKYQCFICTQVLNFIYDIETAIESIYNLLQPNGVVLVTVAGISQISTVDYNQWGDYWRFTDMSIKRHFCKFFGENNVEVFPMGNLATTIAFLQGFSFEDIKKIDPSIFNCNDKDYAMVIGVIAKKVVIN